MATIRRYFCPQCNAYTRADGDSLSHLLHFVLTLFTGGLWLPVWVLLAMTRSYHCSDCGAKARPRKTTAVKFALIAIAATLGLVLAGGLLSIVAGLFIG